MDRGFGFVPDAPSARGSHSLDVVCGSAREMRDTIVLSPLNALPTDQGQTSTCFAHAWANAITQCRRREEPTFERPSPLFLADIAKGVSGTRGLDVGCTLSAVEFAVNKAGFVSETVLPWDASKVSAPIYVHEYQTAIMQIGVRSHRVMDGIRSAFTRAVQSGRGGIVGIDVDESFQRNRDMFWDGMTSERKGGHAMSLCGVSDFGSMFLNSYGDEWGCFGFVWIPWSYLESEHCRSAFVVDAAPSYWREDASV